MAPRFWSFIDEKAAEGLLLSSSLVYGEVAGGNDELANWARERRDSGLFREPDESVQECFRVVTAYVTERHEQRHAARFLEGADPWIIAHAMRDGGRVLTLEKWDDTRAKVKIPNVCSDMDVQCPRNPFEVFRDLGLFLG